MDFAKLALMGALSAANNALAKYIPHAHDSVRPALEGLQTALTGALTALATSP